MPPNGKIPVLLISYYYPPASVGAAQRAYGFARYLDTSKYQVHILIPSRIESAYPSDTEFESPEYVKVHTAWQPNLGFFRRKKQKQFLDQNQPAGRANKSAVFRWISNKIWPDKGIIWAFFAYFKAKALIRKYKIKTIWSTSPLISAHLPALRLRRKFDIKWICDFRDFYWTHNTTFQGHSKWAKALEENCFIYADHITFVTPAMKEIYSAAYPELKGKSTVIWNGTDIISIPEQKASDRTFKTIVYTGTFYDGLRDPAPFLKLINEWLESGSLNSSDWRIVIAGNMEAELINPFIGKPILSILDIKGPLSRMQATACMEEADFLWLIVPDVDSHRDTVPAKFFDYLAFQKPVLAFVPLQSSVYELSREFPQVFIFQPEELDPVESLRFLQILKDDPQNIPYRVSGYTRAAQTLVLEAILEKL
ncbi:MAG: glycosyltransferase [Saprospiraceae bacterium]|nr:glycosyltransferase [Saprospiraceae bacterium]